MNLIVYLIFHNLIDINENNFINTIKLVYEKKRNYN